MLHELIAQHRCLQILQDPYHSMLSKDSPWWNELQTPNTLHFDHSLQQKVQTRCARFWQERFISLRQSDALTGFHLLIQAPFDWAPTQPERLEKALQIADFPPSILHRELHRYSNGELRRLLLARGYMQNPDLWILHDPFGGLDTSFRHHLSQCLESFARDGMRLVVILHRPEERLGSFHALRQEGTALQAWPPAPPSPPTPAEPEIVFTKKQHKTIPTNHGTILFELQRVQVQFQDHCILGPLDWTVRQGEHWAIMGPNGAGKSTLVSLLSADHPQIYRNRISLLGYQPGQGLNVWDHRQRVGLYTPELALHFSEPLNVLETVCSGYGTTLGLTQATTPSERSHAREILRLLQLEKQEQTPFAQLSFDEKRLVLIARALIRPPQVLILDEPTQGMDPIHRTRLFLLLDKISEQTTLILVTHYAKEWPSCITHVLTLDTKTGNSHLA